MTELTITYPYVDHTKKQFVVNPEVALDLKEISMLALMLLRNNPAGKPVVPKVEVVYGGTKKVMEENPFDPDYLEKVEEWERSKQLSLTKFIICMGVSNPVPENVLVTYKEMLPGLSDSDVKYLWISSLVVSAENFNMLTEAVLGQTSITEKGMSDVASSFPGNGEQPTN